MVSEMIGMAALEEVIAHVDIPEVQFFVQAAPVLIMDDPEVQCFGGAYPVLIMGVLVVQSMIDTAGHTTGTGAQIMVDIQGAAWAAVEAARQFVGEVLEKG